MKGKQFRTIIERLGLTQAQAADVCGVGARTLRHWVADEYDVPGPAARLITLMKALKATGQFDWAVREIEDE
jgi:DNA-binding transcriptional regulator YiaG